MVNLLLHNSYYRYREKRKQIKTKVEAQDYQTARTELVAIITEHETKYPTFPNKDFNYGERLMMDHAKRHLDTVIEQNDPTFTDVNGQIKHQSDVVKEALLRVPKSDYS